MNLNIVNYHQYKSIMKFENVDYIYNNNIKNNKNTNK